MDMEKMTEKLQDAFITSQDYALSRNNQELNELHVLQALFNQDESMLMRILSESDQPINPFEAVLDRRTKQTTASNREYRRKRCLLSSIATKYNGCSRV